MDGVVHFAAVGDVHDHFHDMVALVREQERLLRQSMDFVLQVGDLQPNRGDADLRTMAAPAKYKQLGDFRDFWEGRARLPWPLYFIGGNHEPYGLLEGMPGGGQVMDNCHYLGRVGRIDHSGLTIVGLSGIYRADRLQVPRPALAEMALRSNKEYIYFTEAEVELAASLGPADILLVHDWPSGILSAADEAAYDNAHRAAGHEKVGNDYARLLAELLGPQLVLCGHMHRSHDAEIAGADGARIKVCCLADVPQRRPAIATFRAERGRINRLA